MRISSFQFFTKLLNRKNWRITIKFHFKNLSIFFKKSERTHMLGPPPSPVCVCSLLNDPSPSSMNVLFE